jgi:hypothetical protein
MLLRLTLPFFNPSVVQGAVVRWHRREGDRVDHGDDLLVYRFQRIRVARETLGWNTGQIRRTIRAQQAMSHLDVADPRMASAEQRVAYIKIASDSLVRITSADHGYLRRIDAAEGESREVGGLLAVLTTTPDEPLECGTGITASPVDGVSLFAGPAALKSLLGDVSAILFKSKAGNSRPAPGEVAGAGLFRVVQERWVAQ